MANLRHAELVLAPYFDAALEAFREFEPEPGVKLERLKKTKFIVEPSVHDTPRHFAACRDDGYLVMLAPQMADMPGRQVMSLIVHELGHASDFLYPSEFRWSGIAGSAARWEPPGRGTARRLRRWRERGAHEIEMTADAIAQLVTGAIIRYDGECETRDDCRLIQTFGHGVERPEWLR